MQPVGFKITGLEIRGTVNLLFAPTAPHVESLVFVQRGNVMTGTVQLSPVVDADQVTSRQVVVTLNGTDQPPIEAITSPATFTANPGDTFSIVCTDINSVGPSAPSAAFPGTTPAFPPPSGVPTTPTVTGVTFTA